MGKCWGKLGFIRKNIYDRNRGFHGKIDWLDAEVLLGNQWETEESMANSFAMEGFERQNQLYISLFVGIVNIMGRVFVGDYLSNRWV